MGKKHHTDVVSSSAGALQIVKLYAYIQIKMWSVQDKNKDGQHRLMPLVSASAQGGSDKCDQRFPLVSVTVSLVY